MKSVEAKQLLDSIDLAISDIDSFSVAGTKQISYLAKFLVVYICGIYEEVIEIIIMEMIAKLNNAEVNNFIRIKLDRGFRNPDSKKVIELLGEFNQSWKASITALPQKHRDALDSIINNKNSVAHGKNTITFTFEDIKKYYIDSKIVIEEIDAILL